MAAGMFPPPGLIHRTRLADSTQSTRCDKASSCVCAVSTHRQASARRPGTTPLHPLYPELANQARSRTKGSRRNCFCAKEQRLSRMQRVGSTKNKAQAHEPPSPAVNATLPRFWAARPSPDLSDPDRARAPVSSCQFKRQTAPEPRPPWMQTPLKKDFETLHCPPRQSAAPAWHWLASTCAASCRRKLRTSPSVGPAQCAQRLLEDHPPPPRPLPCSWPPHAHELTPKHPPQTPPPPSPRLLQDPTPRPWQNSRTPLTVIRHRRQATDGLHLLSCEQGLRP